MTSLYDIITGDVSGIIGFLGGLIYGFFGWLLPSLWGLIVWIVGSIPYVGPYFIFFMQFIGFIFTEFAWIVYLCVFQYPTTIPALVVAMIFLHSTAVMKMHGGNNNFTRQMAGWQTLIGDVHLIVILFTRLITSFGVLFNGLLQAIAQFIKDLEII